MRKTTAAAATLAAAVLLLTGCGSAEPANQVASGTAGQPQATAPSSAPASLSRDEMAIKFTQCLREQGLDVPDPEPGKGPMLKFDRGSGVTQEKVQQAMEACKEYNPQAEGSPNPQQEENGRKFAECMRNNGVEKFPDPKPGQRGIMIGPGVGDDPDFQKAQEACQPILAGK
jgi:predicted component of type VI protein secretion system